VACTAKRLACPSCGATDQPIHDRNGRSWRHLDFFQYEAWLHAGVPRVDCGSCGKTHQVAVPWAREGSGFTLLFEALALTMCKGLPVSQAAQMLRVRDKRLPDSRRTSAANRTECVRLGGADRVNETGQDRS
jgi:transposase